MKKTLTTFLVIIFVNSICALAQTEIKLIDSKTKNDIPYAHVMIPDGTICKISDQNGIFTIDINDLTKFAADSITYLLVDHIAYDIIKVTFPDPEAKKIVEMYQSQIELAPVTITGDRKSSEVFLVLNGFYRGYQIEDNIPKYYAEGFVQYFIPTEKAERRRARHTILENRILKNTKDFGDKKKGGVMAIEVDDFGPDFLAEQATIEYLIEDFEIKPRSNLHADIICNAHNVGQIIANQEDSIVTLDVDLDFPQKDKIRKMFGYRYLILNKTTSEIYQKSDIDILNYDHNQLQRKRNYRKVQFKHKKEEAFTSIEYIQEIYVIGTQFYDKEQMKEEEINSWYNNKWKCSYKEDFLDRVERLNLPALPSFIKNSMGETLIEQVDGGL
jgi:hypothetical protein